jgi:hypothetical protein
MLTLVGLFRSPSCAHRPRNAPRIGALTETWRRSGPDLRIGIAHGFATLGTYPDSLAWRWTRFRSGRRRVASWRRRRRILRWRVSGIAAGRRRGGRPIPRRRPIPRGRRRVITRRHTPATIWTKTIAGRAHASIWDAVAISVTMKARAAASRHKKNIRFREWSCEPCNRGALCTVGKHQACERNSKRNR